MTHKYIQEPKHNQEFLRLLLETLTSEPDPNLKFGQECIGEIDRKSP